MPPRSQLLAVTLAVAIGAGPALAAVEEPYQPGEAAITTTWFALRSDTAQRADRDYVAGMLPHHAGALSMSRDYLADPGRSSPLLRALARAIVANQRFEIGVLEAVARNLDAPPMRLPFGLTLQPVATEGLTQAQRFLRAPVPSPAGHALGPVSARDVLFAKAMTIHHEAAVQMARAYHANPAARNGFLGLMNVDIVTDQTQEIALMRVVVDAYRGDAGAIVPDPSMVHGMEGMQHAAHAGHGAAPAAGSAAPPMAVRPPPRRPAGGPDGHAHHHH
ncbi:DUF305 domain-containing protein [Roseococcus sp. SYP-B2431]|uniref:DUF305 domain-containing protein n=1 Tax=Roseococcus sp. SYP-B2431 TaxID=2496640 RepID=UPI0013F44E9A|nr:DUF305 domain-containing protein [Roseococcus sp. SYP-B2431]